jgi:adenine-specific DNA methylase
VKANPKRLIEVDLPIARISAHARREKSIRHGHISTLHIWWARRPLAACRAVICAALWPDPADSLCPPAFRTAAIEALTAFAKRVNPERITEEKRQLQETMSEESRGRWEALAAGTLTLNPDEETDMPVLRMALLDFIADFANWDNSTVPAYLETSRALTQAAHASLGGIPGTKPLVVDPFAGGGSIPLEALRVGADAFASDLNPIPVLLNKVVLEYIPKYGERLADEVRLRGNQIQEQVEAELRTYYPTSPKGDVPLAYLWARTIISEAPGTGEYPVEIPLMRSMWLAKASSQDRALRWVRDASGRVIGDAVDVAFADGTSQKVLRPRLEIFAPKKGDTVETGTVARGSATCPITGYTTPITSVRRQLKARRGGASDARLLAVRQSNPAVGDRTYRPPNEADISAANAAKVALFQNSQSDEVRLSWLPDEPTPLGGGRGAGRAFSQRNYGMDLFKDLFTPRQMLALTTLARGIDIASAEVTLKSDRDFALAVQSCLSLSFGRLTDFCSSLCTLNATGNRGVFHTFARQALPIVWDFMETAPLNEIGANWIGGIETLEATIRAQAVLSNPGHVERASATKHPLPNDSAAALVTDPPYYDAVPYSDLSDYFYVWLKRSMPPQTGFDDLLTPKEDECIVDDAKGKDDAFFERTMGHAMSEARRVLQPSGIGVVVFAHKSTGGWEAQLQAMVEAGWTITASWPIDTERPARLRAMGSAALASSVHLVCRPREDANGAVRESVGEWRDVLGELPKRIHEWMPRLAAEGVVGADAIFACLGPSLEIFSRYSHVEKANGETATLREYLEHVWGAVSTEALSLIFKDANAAGLEPDARLSAMWLWTIGGGSTNGNGTKSSDAESDDADDSTDDDDESSSSSKGKATGGFVLEYDAARKIAQGLGVHLEQCETLVEVKGDKARLLPVAERTTHLFGKGTQAGTSGIGRRKKEKQKTLFAELDEAEAAEAGWTSIKGPAPGSTVLDRVHQAMILFAANRSELLKRFLVEDGVGKDARFWKLADNLNKLYPSGTEERRWVEGVLARKKGLGL